MSEVKLDLSEGSSISDGVNGTVAVRTGIISGLSGNKDQILASARNVTGLPVPFSFHPTISGIVLTDRNIEALGAGKASVVLTYSPVTYDQKPPDETAPGVIQVGSSTQSVTTSKDRSGNPIVIKITKKETDDSGNITTVNDEQIAQIQIEESRTVLSQTRVEKRPPTAKSITYSGTVNKLPIWGFGARTLLCLRIEGTNLILNDETVYSVIYEFVYNNKTWDAVSVFIDEENGSPHKDIDVKTGNGINVTRYYDETDFRSLSLVF